MERAKLRYSILSLICTTFCSPSADSFVWIIEKGGLGEQKRDMEFQCAEPANTIHIVPCKCSTWVSD